MTALWIVVVALGAAAILWSSFDLLRKNCGRKVPWLGWPPHTDGRHVLAIVLGGTTMVVATVYGRLTGIWPVFLALLLVEVVAIGLHNRRAAREP